MTNSSWTSVSRYQGRRREAGRVKGLINQIFAALRVKLAGKRTIDVQPKD